MPVSVQELSVVKSSNRQTGRAGVCQGASLVVLNYANVFLGGRQTS